MTIRLKSIFRYDPAFPKVRLFRVTWETGTVGDGQGYSTKLTFNLVPRWFEWVSFPDDKWLTVLGVQVHRKRSYGGIFP